MINLCYDVIAVKKGTHNLQKKGRIIMKLNERLVDGGYNNVNVMKSSNVYLDVIKYIPKKEFDNYDVTGWVCDNFNKTADEIIYSHAVNYFVHKYLTREFRLFTINKSIVSEWENFANKKTLKTLEDGSIKERFEIFSQNITLFDTILKDAQRWSKICKLNKSNGKVTIIKDTEYPKNLRNLFNAFKNADIKYDVLAYKKKDGNDQYIGYKVTINNVVYEFSKEFGGRLDKHEGVRYIFDSDIVPTTIKSLTTALTKIGVNWYGEKRNECGDVYYINLGETFFYIDVTDGKNFQNYSEIKYIKKRIREWQDKYGKDFINDLALN